MKNIIAHPLVQVFSFCIILINGKEWDALPFGWFILFGSADAQVFAIIGLIAILIAMASVFWRRNYLQPLSLIMMWSSLGAFFWQLSTSHQQLVFKGGAGLITGLLFLTVTVVVFNARLTWKNF